MQSGKSAQSHNRTSQKILALWVIQKVHVGSMDQAEIDAIVAAQIAQGGISAAPTGVAALPSAATPTSLATPQTALPPTATGTGAGARTEAGSGLEGCVTSASLNVRTRPSADGSIVDWYRNGKCYTFDGHTADLAWLRLSADKVKNGERLWVTAKFIQLKGDINTLPVVK